jgi:hypothetical protein
MSQYSLYHNHIRLSVPCTTLPEEDRDILLVLQRLIKEYTSQEWKPDDRYVLMTPEGDCIVYDNGFIYRMADSG